MLKHPRLQRARRHRISMTGGVLVEASVSVILIIAVCIPLIIFGVNLAFQLLYQSQIAHIANETARVVDESRYWLGLPRPDYDENAKEATINRAKKAAESMCRKIGFPGVSATIEVVSEDDLDLTICSLNVNAIARIPFRLVLFNYDFAQLFPGNISARGVAAHAKTQPYAVMHLDCPVEPSGHPNGYVFGPGEGPPLNRGVAVIPAYGFWHHVPPDHGKLGPYGKLGGFQGTGDIKPPRQFAAMNMVGFTSRNELLRVLKPNPDGTLPGPHMPAPGEYTTTGYLQPSSYNIH
jgi:hypothetical protein